MKTFAKINSTLFLLLILITSFVGSLPVFSEETTKEKTAATEAKSKPVKVAKIEDWLIIPVYYATNRATFSSTDTGEYAETANPKGLSFGVKNYIVPLPINSPVDDATQTKMQWQKMHVELKKRDEAPYFDKTKCPVQNKVLSYEEIVPAFNAYRATTGNPENIVYVHGCCANFDTVMSRAATLAAHMQAPVLVYDWVSPHGFTNYLVNETMISQTVDDFCKFTNKVESLMDPKEITYVGHSMGAELVDQAMVRRAALMKANPSMPKFKEIIMSNADVDVLAFIKHGNDFTSNAEKTRFYFSTNDKRLKLSKFVHGGFLRLGAPGPHITDLVKIKNAQFIDITNNQTGHDLPYWLVANMHRFDSIGSAKGFELKPEAAGYLMLERDITAQQEVSEAPIKCVCTPKASSAIK